MTTSRQRGRGSHASPDLLEADEDIEAPARLRKAERIGRPIGSEVLLAMREARPGRRLRPQPRGPKPRGAGDSEAAGAG